MARMKDMLAGFPETLLGAQASGLKMVRQYRHKRWLLSSPLVGGGGTGARTRSLTDGGVSSTERPYPLTRLASDDASHPLPQGERVRKLHRRGGDAAVDDDGLAGHEARGVGGEVGDGAGDLVGFADAAQGRGGAAALQALLVFPQRAGEIGFH